MTGEGNQRVWSNSRFIRHCIARGEGGERRINK